MKYRRLQRLSIIPIVMGLHHQLYPNDFVNYSLALDGLQVTLMELGRTAVETFTRFYSKMAILNNGTNMNMIIIL